MADNAVVANPGTGGATFASDQIAGIEYPRAKIVWGVDGTATDTAAGSDAMPIQDGGNSITVDGTVTANAGTGPFPVSDNSGSLTVDAPVGTPVFVRLSDGSAAISALPITDNSGSLTVDGTVTANLAAGTNNIGDVDVLTVPAPLNVTGTGTESAALRVTIATDSTGVLSVDDNGGSLTVDGTVSVSGTVTVADNQVIADNGGFTDGTSKVFVAGYIYDEVAGTGLTENDAAAGRINVNRAQVATIEDGTTRGRYATVSAANALKVDGSAVTQPVSIAASVTVAQATASSLNAQIIGSIARDAAVSANPVTVGGRASTAVPSAVSADGDSVDVWLDLNGATIHATRPVTSGGAANVSSSATNVTLLSSNTARKGFTIYNDSTALLYVKFGATASTTSFHVQLVSGAYYESPAGFLYTGIIDGIWSAANGSARVGEFT